MDINKGFNTDTEPINLPSGSWIKAKNIIRQVGKGIKTHKGFDLIPNVIVGNIIGKIEMESITVLFHYDTTTHNFTISKYNGTNITTILNINTIACLTYLGITSSTQISGTYTYNYKGETIISFFDYVNKGKPFLINIDNLPVSTFTTIDKVDLLLLQPSFKTPFFNVTESFKGGNLKCGKYQFAIAYEINDFDFTTPSLFSEPVFIGDFKYRNVKSFRWDSNTNNIVNYSSTEDCSLASNYGQITNNAITLRLHNLDTKFNRFKLLVLFSTGESNEAYTAGIYNVSSSLILKITGSELYAEDYDTLILNRTRFEGITSLSSFQNKLSIGGLEYEDDEVWLDKDLGKTFQFNANNIKLKFAIDQIPETEFDKLSSINMVGELNPIYHANKPHNIFQYSTFQPDEVYAFYIAFGKGNKISKAYHIPGRERKLLVFEDDEGINSYSLHENDNARAMIVPASVIEDNPLYFPINDNEKSLNASYVGWYQIRDTASRTTWELGYWENRDEEYPNTINYSNVSGNIRHHKMPSLSACYYQGAPVPPLYVEDNLNYRITVYFDYNTLDIPDEIASKYDTVYLLYADRTYDESTVLGMSPVFSDRVGFCAHSYNLPYDLKPIVINTRFYDFGLNALKPNISPNYIKGEFLLNNISTQYGLYEVDGIPHRFHNIDVSNFLLKTNNTYLNLIQLVNGYNYAEEGDSTVTPPNILDFNNNDSLELVNREAVLLLFCKENEDVLMEGTAKEIESSTLLELIYKNIQIGVDVICTLNTGGEAYSLYLGTLKSFKTSAYLGFESKNLILANCINTNTANRNGLLITDLVPSSYPTTLRWTGDCVVNNDFIRTRVSYYTGTENDLFHGEVCVTSLGYIYPNYSRVNSCFRVDNKSMYENETYSYNTIFSQRNSINLFQPSNPELTNQLEVKTRFTRSAVLGSESKEIGWRIFNLLEYFDFPTTAGEFTYIFGGDLSIMFGFTNDIYVAEIKETLETGTGNTLALRTNNLFDTSPIRITDIFERSVHINTQNHIFTTKFGFVFYDNINKNIYLFDGKSIPLAISKLGMDKYVKSLNNVVKLTGGYDEETDHIFFTIAHSMTYHTWSFYLTEKQIVSQYDFGLNHYFVNKGRLYGVTTNNKLIGFNSSTEFAKYYPNTTATQFQSYIDIVFTDYPQLSKLIESIVWNEKTTIDQTNSVNSHTTDIIIYNEFQCAVIRVFGDYIKYVNGNWHWNNIKDAKKTSSFYLPSDTLDYEKLAYVLLPDNTFTIVNPNETYYVEEGSATYNGRIYTVGSKIRTTNQSALIVSLNSKVYYLKNWFDKSNIICKFAIIRVILNDADTSNKEVILNDLIVNYSKSI